MQNKNITTELLKLSRVSAEREKRTMLVFLIDMALLEADLSMPAVAQRPRPARAHVPQIGGRRQEMSQRALMAAQR